jgi:dienelactone hydrolase
MRFTTILSATLLGIALAQAAAADIAYISPDGRRVAFVGEPSDPQPNRDQIRIVDVDCLFDGKSRAECSEMVFEGAGMTGRISWASDSKSFIRTRVGRLWFKAIEGAGAQPESLWGEAPIDSTVFDPELFPGRDKQPAGLVGADRWERRISNAHGDLIGQVVEQGETTTLVLPSGFQMGIPNEIAWRPPDAPAKYEIGASAWSDDVYFWSASMGEAGLLQRLGPRGAEIIPNPDGLFGPAKLVWDVGTGEPVSLLDPFGFYPFAAKATELDWLSRSIKELRTADPSLELEAVSTTSSGQTAIVRMVQGLTCTKTYIVRVERTQPVDRVCNEKRMDFGTPVVTPHAIPGDGHTLKGRLYSWSATRPAEGLLIVFEGGPQSNSVLGRPWIAAEALSDRFDLLVVDYRGSIGFGWNHLTTLRQPLSNIATQDLRAVIDWVAMQPAFTDKHTGFWGESWGGYAGLLALTRGLGPIDFVVSNSGFIENAPDSGLRCKLGMFRLLLGADVNNNCNGAQLVEETPKSAVPLLMLVGDQDKQALPDVARKWTAAAKASGACVGMISSALGGHVLQWPTQSRNAAMQATRDWVTSALARRPEACELALTAD